MFYVSAFSVFMVALFFGMFNFVIVLFVCFLFCFQTIKKNIVSCNSSVFFFFFQSCWLQGSLFFQFHVLVIVCFSCVACFHFEQLICIICVCVAWVFFLKTGLSGFVVWIW